MPLDIFTNVLSEDQRSIANRLANEERRSDSEDISPEAALSQKDSTAPARLHGNEPSKGAKIDQELQEEEEEYLRQKGKK